MSPECPDHRLTDGWKMNPVGSDHVVQVRIDFQNFDLERMVTGKCEADPESESGEQTAVQTCHQPVNQETDWLALGSLAEV
jgi:hypothetical protein